MSEEADPKQYVKKMKARDPELGSNWGTICTLVDMKGKDGRMHEQIILPRSKTADLQQLAENFDRFKASTLSNRGENRLADFACGYLPFPNVWLYLCEFKL